MNEDNIFNFSICNEKKFKNQHERMKELHIYKDKLLDNNAPDIIFNNNYEIAEMNNFMYKKNIKEEENIVDSNTELNEKFGLFLCHKCDQIFSRKIILLRHLEKSHSLILNTIDILKCTYEGCKKKFTNKKCLKQHLKIHSKIRFTCRFCDKLLKSKECILQFKF